MLADGGDAPTAQAHDVADGPRVEAPAQLDLFWVPLGAGGASVVAGSGRAYESLVALAGRRRPVPLFHAALVASVGGMRTSVEVAPTPDDDGARARGVVGFGPVGARWLGRWRLFRYEVRRWVGGEVPDLRFAVGGPVRLSDRAETVAFALDLVARAPTPVWGRDELRAGEMWNSNSLVAWVLERAGLARSAGRPPGRGRAPGWDAGIAVARRGL